MPIDTAIFHKSLYLDEGELQPPDFTCLFCTSSLRHPVYTLQKTPEVLLLQCKACHAVSASRMPTDEALLEYYSVYYDSPESQASDGQITFDSPLRLARNLAGMYLRHQDETHGSILDVGGGDGTISHLVAMQLIERGATQVNVTVVDYNKKIVRPHDSRIAIDRADSLADVGGLYGFVIASAVIEHSPHPRTLLLDLLQRMEQGGIFYARTPYMLPIMKLLQLIGVKVNFTYPGHLHDLGQAFWEGYFTMKQADDFQILDSRPAIVETTFRKHLARTVVAYCFKIPWYLFGKSYKYVGGWEVFVRKGSDEDVAGRQ